MVFHDLLSVQAVFQFDLLNNSIIIEQADVLNLFHGSRSKYPLPLCTGNWIDYLLSLC